MRLVGMKILLNLSFVVNFKGSAKVFGGRMFLILIVAFDGHLSLVRLEFTAQHFNVRREPVKRIAPGMHRDESVTGFNPINKSFAIGQWQISRGIRENDA